MASVSRPTAASSARSPAGDPTPKRFGDQEIADFDLRDVLADITVRETSFAEFLAALRQAGRRPA